MYIYFSLAIHICVSASPKSYRCMYLLSFCHTQMCLIGQYLATPPMGVYVSFSSERDIVYAVSIQCQIVEEYLLFIRHSSILSASPLFYTYLTWFSLVIKVCTLMYTYYPYSYKYVYLLFLSYTRMYNWFTAAIQVSSVKHVCICFSSVKHVFIADFPQSWKYVYLLLFSHPFLPVVIQVCIPVVPHSYRYVYVLLLSHTSIYICSSLSHTIM